MSVNGEVSERKRQRTVKSVNGKDSQNEGGGNFGELLECWEGSIETVEVAIHSKDWSFWDPYEQSLKLAFAFHEGGPFDVDVVVSEAQ
jgi:hypothetical protein